MLHMPVKVCYCVLNSANAKLDNVSGESQSYLSILEEITKTLPELIPMLQFTFQDYFCFIFCVTLNFPETS